MGGARGRVGARVGRAGRSGEVPRGTKAASG